MAVAIPAVRTKLSFQHIIVIIGLVAFAFVFSAGYLQSHRKWWYEDDPLQYHYVSTITNPLDIFTHPAVMRSFGTGNALVPVQLLSYWLDVRLFGPYPLPAYLHNLLVFVVVTVLLYLVLLAWTNQWLAAASGTLLWMFLPSTLVVHQYIATRHYMEGLGFTLALCYVTQWILQARRMGIWMILAVATFGILAMLCKEIYAAVIPAFLVLVGLGLRRYWFAVLAVGLALSYAVYHLVFLGVELTYTMRFVTLNDYLRFLSRLPYMLTASIGGYLFYLAVALLTVIRLGQDWRQALRSVLLVLALLAAALVAVYPVTFAVLKTYQLAGTWYRIPFFINTLVLLYAIYLSSQIIRRRTHLLGIIALSSLIILPNTELTRENWAISMARAEAEGKFYLVNPDKLLYSEEDAPWFIFGVHELYNVSRRHYINKQYHTDQVAHAAIQQYPTIWRYRNGEFVADDRLYERIKKENAGQH